MPYTIRPSDISDTEILGKVHSQAWEETYPGLIPADTLAKIGSIEARTAARREIFVSATSLSAHFLVEDSAGKVVGFGDCGPAREVGQFAPAEIITLYLLREAQGKGVGKKLLFRMLAHLCEKDFSAAALKTNAGSDNSNNFYRHCGGHAVAEIPGKEWMNTVYVWDNLKDFAVR
jgi:L-amino acid N-acyltransferase YncA